MPTGADSRHLAVALAISWAASGCHTVPSDVAPPEPEPASDEQQVIVEAKPRAPACSARTPSGAPLLIPGSADAIVHLSPRAILDAPIGAELVSTLSQTTDWRRVEQVFGACGVPLETVDHVLLGVGFDEEIAVVLVGSGLGQPEVAGCLIAKTRTEVGGSGGSDGSDGKSDEAGVEILAVPGDPGVSTVELDEGRAYLFHPDVLALTTVGWEGAVYRLGTCDGVAAIQGDLGARVATLDPSLPAWFVARTPPELGASVADLTGGVDGELIVTGSMQLHDQLALSVRAELGDPQAATSLVQMLQSGLVVLGSAMPPGLEAVPGRVVVQSQGAIVGVDVSLTVGELRSLLNNL